jgi:hypothetical protein
LAIRQINEVTIMSACIRIDLAAFAVMMALVSLCGASGPKAAPEGVSASDWAEIRAAYEAGRRAIRSTEDGGFAAENPGQRWTMRFDGAGFKVRPRDGGWSWGLELRGFGREGAVRPVARGGRMTADESRLAVARGGGLSEWYVNGADGLMQGWTLGERPAGAGDRLVLRFAVRGGLAPKASRDGRAVAFADEAGATVLTYSGLKVWDATGRELKAALTDGDGGVALAVEDRGATYPLTIDPIAQQAYLKAANPNQFDNFGGSVAVSGDTVVVGAGGEQSNATGVNGNPSDNSADGAGAAYVFVRTGGTWTQQAYLKASNTDGFDFFGTSVAVSGDTVVVGASGEDSNAAGVNGDQSDNSASLAGAAYVFVRTGGTWSQQAYLKASNSGQGDQFGGAVAVSGDTVVVAAKVESSNATGVNGNQADNSASFAGAAYVFVRAGGTWTQQAYLKASNSGQDDQFGRSVAVSGDTITVGAIGESSSAAGVNGNQADDSLANAGAAYVFARTGGTWMQEAYLKASNPGQGDQFGNAVAVSGDTVVVAAISERSNAAGVNGNQTDNSAAGAGAAYVFVRAGGTWSQQAYLKASNPGQNDNFGAAVSVSGDTIAVGAKQESSNATGVNGNQSDNSASFAGAAYIFARTGGTWTQQAYLKASNPDANDQFGGAVAVSGDTVVVGAKQESSNATGVNGNQADNSASFAGAAYVFLLGPAGNDDFANAREVTGPLMESYTTQATGEAGEPFHVPPFNNVINSIWWTWTAPADGTAEFDTFGSNFDTVLAAYTGDSLNTLVSVAGNDDSGSDLQSRVSFPAVAGRTYRIAVDGAGDATGLVFLHSAFTADSPTPTPKASAPVIQAPRQAGVKGTTGKVRVTVVSGLPGVKLTVKASGGAQVKVRGKNPFRVIVKKITRAKTRLKITATDALGQKTLAKVLLTRAGG